MIKRILLSSLDSFGRRFGYNVDYLRHLVRTDLSGFWKFSLATRLAFHRTGVPAATWYAAKIITARAEDCGPCTQLVVDMALRDGVPDGIVTAVLTDDEAAMGADAAVGWRLARGVTERRGDLLAEAITEAKARWGDRGHASLALVIAGSRLFPTLKAALGFAMACRRVTVAGLAVEPARRAA